METSLKENRVQRIHISHHFLFDLLHGDEIHFKILNPIPEDTTILAFDTDVASRSIICVILSHKFDKVAEGAIMPQYLLELEDLSQKFARFDERCDEIVDHCNTIAVREQVDGEWGSHFLTELPPKLAIKHALRFLKEGRTPVRVKE